MKSKYFNALLTAFTLTFIFAASASAQTSIEQTTTATQAQTVKTIKLKVAGITCSGDCKDIQKVVSDMNGVKACKQIGKPSATSVFEVSFNPAVISEKEIRSAVEATPGCEDPKDRPYKVKQG